MVTKTTAPSPHHNDADGTPNTTTGSESLADIAKLGASLEQASEAPEVTSKPSNNQAELLATLSIIRGMALPVIDIKKRDIMQAAWDDNTLHSVSVTGAAVLDKHGIIMSDAMGAYGIYIALAAALAPPVLTTMRVLKEKDVPPAKPADGQQQQA